MGIVASQVTESFHRPAVVIAIRAEEGLGKGSVRSFGGKDVLAALRSCAGELKTFGGHRHAAGLSLDALKLEVFEQAFDEAVGLLPQDEAARPLYFEGELSLAHLTIQTLRELESLGPFGPGNPEPLFRFRAKVGNVAVVKERHLRVLLHGDDGAGSRAVSGIWFNAAEREDLNRDLLQNVEANWVAVPELNRFRGHMNPSLRIKDWQVDQ